MKSRLKLRFGLVLASALVRCAPAQIITTDTYIEFAQRGPGGTVETRGAVGSSNAWKLWGFNAAGVFGPLTLSEVITGSGYTFTVADGSITSAKIADGTVATGDLADGAITSAKIADGTVATGDLADGSITSVKIADGTIAVGDIADGAVNSAKILDGAIGNADVSASAAIALTKLSQRVGTTWVGTTAAPISTSPYSPTWTTETLAIVYSGTAINLPPIATYDGAALVVVTPGATTVAVDPSGTEQIWKSGSLLAAGVADSITGSAGLMTTYVARSGNWVRIQGGGGGGSGDAQLVGGNSFTGNQSVEGNITATGTISGNHSGSAALMFDIPGPEIDGPLSNNLDKGRYFSPWAPTWIKTDIPATTGATITIDMSKAHSVIHLNEATETIAFNGLPEEGTPVIIYIDAHSADCAVTTPSIYSEAKGGNRGGFTVRNGKDAIWRVWRFEGAWWQWEPVEMEDLDEATTVTLSDKVEVSVNGVSKFANLGTVKKGLRVGTKLMGAIAAGFTTSPTTLDWESNDTILCYVGGSGTHNLPAASSLGGVAAIFYTFNVSGTITLNPDDADYIRFTGTTQADGVSLTITGTPGQTAIITTDGTNWNTAGGTASFSAGS